MIMETENWCVQREVKYFLYVVKCSAEALNL